MDATTGCTESLVALFRTTRKAYRTLAVANVGEAPTAYMLCYTTLLAVTISERTHGRESERGNSGSY